MTENVNHPAHYGGEDNPYETIKVIESMGIGYEFCVGNAVKYLMRAGLKNDAAEDLDKAAWYCARAAKNSREDQERTYESHKKALSTELVQADDSPSGTERLKEAIDRLESQERHPAGKIHITPAESYQFPLPVNPPTCNGCLGTSGNHSCGAASEWKTEYTKWSGRPE